MSRLDCEGDDEHLFHHRALDENPRQICRPPSGVERRSRCRRQVHAAITHQSAVQSGNPPRGPGALANRLQAYGGTRRPPRPAAPRRVLAQTAYWKVRSFRNYADYALTEPFASGLAQLREQGSQRRCTIMCAEAVWWRCHRRIITDYLLAAGEQVMHILGTSQVEEARLTPGAVLRDDGTVVYPAESPRPG